MAIKTSLNEHETFWAFILLLLSILIMMVVASQFDRASAGDVVVQAKLRIIDSTIAGMLTILGMAAQALFRTNQADKDLASAAKATAEKVPPVTGEAAASKDKANENSV